MEKAIAEKIRDACSEQCRIRGDSITISRKDNIRSRIEKGGFHTIRDDHSLKRIAFVDGGQACIFRSPSVSLYFIRAFCAVIRKNRTSATRKEESYMLIKAADEKGGGESYLCEAFHHEEKGMGPDSISRIKHDDRIFERADEGDKMDRIAGLMRRISEIRLCRIVAESLDEGDMIVLDGTLEAVHILEEECLDELYRVGMQRNILVTALSKTSSQLTDMGRSVNAALMLTGPDDAWYYYPPEKGNDPCHRARPCYLKLHRSSGYVFRHDIFSRQADIVNIGKIAGFMKVQSRDAAFPGYPYGLIRADRFARVSEREKEYMRTKLRTLLGKEYRHLEPFIKAGDAHSVLDSIS